MHVCLRGGSATVVVVKKSVGLGGWVGGNVGFGHVLARGLEGELLSLCVPHVEVE